MNDGLLAPTDGPDVDTDARLLRRIAVGDRRAVAELYDRLGTAVFQQVSTTAADSALALVAVRDTFLEVWRTADDYVPELGSGREWVLGLARTRVAEGSEPAASDATAGEPPTELRAILVKQLDDLIDSGVGPSALRVGEAGDAPAALAPVIAPSPLTQERRVEPNTRFVPRELSDLDDDADDAALRRGSQRRKRRQRFFAGVVAVALLIGIGSGALLSVLGPRQSEEGTALEQVQGADDGMRVTTPVPGGGEATLNWSARLGQAVLITEGMTAPDGGGSYELWLLRDGAAISAGVFVPEEGLSAVPIVGVLAPGDTVIVTEEPSGGSPTGAPGSEPLLTFNIDSGENTGTSGIPA